MTQELEIVSEVGRLVQGSLWTPNDKDFHGKPLTDNNGNPRVQYFISIAFEKANPKITEMMKAMSQLMQASWPNGEWKADDFAKKVIDGDKQPEKEGFKGCWVLKFSSGFAPTVYGSDGKSVLTDPESVKKGYFVRVIGKYKSNQSKANPGMFLNLNAVQFKGFGDEIRSQSGEIFNQNQTEYVPAGMSAAPTSSGNAPRGFEPKAADYGILEKPIDDNEIQF